MKKKWWAIILVVILIIGGAGFTWWWLHGGRAEIDDVLGNDDALATKHYSNFTGLETSNPNINDAPTFCIQVPNGSTDGARPQAGLTHAGVVFEAIAESGITRFAAIFQEPNTGIIGPIRSLRPYYLSWDTPFDCTIVHDGGSPEALAALRNGNYRNLDEDFEYMWKVNEPSRLWNNVFTSPTKLAAFNHAHDYRSSNPQVFPRLTSDEVHLADLCTEETPDCNNSHNVNHIHTQFTNLTDYVVNYAYDRTTNTYRRSYDNGQDHLVYDCPANIDDFSRCGELKQVSPSVVIAMHVQENTMSDNYHEDIKTIGEGKAEIFQNGTMIEATWKKVAQDRQIEFHDASGSEIKFTPGQIWIAAVPQFGRVSWE